MLLKLSAIKNTAVFALDASHNIANSLVNITKWDAVFFKKYI